MAMPNFSEEKKLWKRGVLRVCGLDEAGRGPLAGPVVAAAVSVKFQVSSFKLQGVNDSKKLTEKQREELFELLTNHADIEFGVGIVSEKIIDKINILEASKLAMKKAVENLQPDYLLIDGNFLLDMVVNQKAVIKGDSKVFSIAAASIIAKVTRDRIMRQMDKTYPEYGFVKHKGYGTAAHLASLKKYGLSPIHRLTFAKVLQKPGISDTV